MDGHVGLSLDHIEAHSLGATGEFGNWDKLCQEILKGSNSDTPLKTQDCMPVHHFDHSLLSWLYKGAGGVPHIADGVHLAMVPCPHRRVVHRA